MDIRSPFGVETPKREKRVLGSSSPHRPGKTEFTDSIRIAFDIHGITLVDLSNVLVEDDPFVEA